jgi:hypothetical protein
MVLSHRRVVDWLKVRVILAHLVDIFRNILVGDLLHLARHRYLFVALRVHLRAAFELNLEVKGLVLLISHVLHYRRNHRNQLLVLFEDIGERVAGRDVQDLVLNHGRELGLYHRQRHLPCPETGQSDYRLQAHQRGVGGLLKRGLIDVHSEYVYAAFLFNFFNLFTEAECEAHAASMLSVVVPPA